MTDILRSYDAKKPVYHCTPVRAPRRALARGFRRGKATTALPVGGTPGLCLRLPMIVEEISPAGAPVTPAQLEPEPAARKRRRWRIALFALAAAAVAWLAWEA